MYINIMLYGMVPIVRYGMVLYNMIPYHTEPGYMEQYTSKEQ